MELYEQGGSRNKEQRCLQSTRNGNHSKKKAQQQLIRSLTILCSMDNLPMRNPSYVSKSSTQLVSVRPPTNHTDSTVRRIGKDVSMRLPQQRIKTFSAHKTREFANMQRWMSPVTSRQQTTAVRKRQMAGTQLEQHRGRGRRGHGQWIWQITSLELYCGSSSLSEQSATWPCWRCWSGAEVSLRSVLSCSLGRWRSPTSVWCWAPLGWKLMTQWLEVSRSGRSLARYSSSGNGWRWMLLYGLWPLSQLIGIYQLIYP